MWGHHPRTLLLFAFLLDLAGGLATEHQPVGVVLLRHLQVRVVDLLVVENQLAYNSARAPSQNLLQLATVPVN